MLRWSRWPVCVRRVLCWGRARRFWLFCGPYYGGHFMARPSEPHLIKDGWYRCTINGRKYRLAKTEKAARRKFTTLMIEQKPHCVAAWATRDPAKAKLCRTFRIGKECEVCKWPRNAIMARYLQKHHIQPQCNGGTDGPENLTLLCPSCHAIAHHFLKQAPCRYLAADRRTVLLEDLKLFMSDPQRWAIFGAVSDRLINNPRPAVAQVAS
jgi:hypothetical protein